MATEMAINLENVSSEGLLKEFNRVRIPYSPSTKKKSLSKTDSGFFFPKVPKTITFRIN